MIGNSLLTQVIIAGIAIGIIMTYIQPNFAEIKTRQNQIVQTKDELQRVNEVNQRLDELYRQLNAISQQDKASLLVYLPDQIDEVQILKDLSYMARDAKVLLGDVRYEGPGQRDSSATDADPYPHTFSLRFESSYEAMKNFLTYLERNNYPLIVTEMSVSPTEGGFLDVGLALVTYSFKEDERTN